MRQLVLYSDQVIAANQQADEYLLQLLGTTGARTLPDNKLSTRSKQHPFLISILRSRSQPHTLGIWKVSQKEAQTNCVHKL
ncbi:hypothetical protein [Nostoc commune]|uniref:hypothetical protein n=1 Tax=Nostoc commune TaxID=1178 RepID=UPI0018C64280|nr:hypothetical protein [Nostoc commune]MBG1258020.1 hypothetical protein [Nostoc commune BAE]